MHDNQPNLMPPTSGDFAPATPSGLTPNTRSEAEAALWRNSMAQTDSAAPTTPLPVRSGVLGTDDTSNTLPQTGDGIDEAQQAYHRPRGGPLRASSTNYAKALQDAHKESTADSTVSMDTTEGAAEGERDTAIPTKAVPFPLPPPGQGVVPLHTGVGTGQAEALKRARARGLSLGGLGRQPSWSEQDMKHIYSAGLMGDVKKGDAGYGSTDEVKDASQS